MKKGLVSIITPCYNGEKYVHRLLESILIQDYPHIEMFVVDDGSTDNTKDIIESYIPKFQNKGYVLTYIHQENAGQASALNKGLKLINGEYLIWPDSDDYYCTDKAISTFVDAFKRLDDSYGMVRCQGYNIDENTLEVISERNHNVHSENLFEAYFYGKENIGGAGLFMIRMDIFNEVVKNRDIYDQRHPQNMQMIFPITYSYKTLTIKERLHCILCRPNSHSHSKKNFEMTLNDIQGFLDIYNATLNKMSNIKSEVKNKLKHDINKKLLNIQMTYSIRNERFDRTHCIYKRMKNINVTLSSKNKILYFLLIMSPTLLLLLVRNIKKTS